MKDLPSADVAGRIADTQRPISDEEIHGGDRDPRPSGHGHRRADIGLLRLTKIHAKDLAGSRGDEEVLAAAVGGREVVLAKVKERKALIGPSTQEEIRTTLAIPGNADVATFLAGVTNEQVWFQKVGRNLEASVIGTDDKFVLRDWYRGEAFRVERFQTTEGGKALLQSDVQGLVDAMAAFAPPPAGVTTLPLHYRTALAPVIAANWQ